MALDLEQLETIFRVARRVMEDADATAKQGIRHAAGRLRRLRLDNETLRELKSELASFNSHTGKWRR